MRPSMRLAAVLVAVLPAVSALADSLSIELRLSPDGAAAVTEVWDISPHRGTEWYLVRSNLGDIRIEDFSVSDETGLTYYDTGRWDVDRSITQKAGQCGIVSKSDGCELCWGIGSYGHHTYTVSYTMTKAVKSMDDYDCLHLQLVSPGIRDVPSDVRVRVSAPEPLSSDNARAWGFGYNGALQFSDGDVVASTSSFDSDCSVIVLLRLDKGIVSPGSTRPGSFDKVLEKAMEGADFGEDDSGWAPTAIFAAFLAIFGLAIYGGIRSERKRLEGITGYRKLKEIGWKRDAPYNGDLLPSAYTLKEIEHHLDIGAVASSMILRMIQDGQLTVHNEGRRDKICLSFNDSALRDDMPASVRSLYGMLKEAAGSDQLLQDKEFSRWNSRHAKAVTAWVDALETEGRQALVKGDWMSVGGKYSPSGQEQACRVVGLRKFLKDYTLVDERRSAEAVVWNDYLVFAALYGIADKVARELADINPRVLQQTFLGDEAMARRIIVMSNNYGRTITGTNTAARSAAKASAGGFGGHSSFGGGGGFSGGGFGGGSR